MVDIDKMDLETYIAVLNYKKKKEDAKTDSEMDKLGI